MIELEPHFDNRGFFARMWDEKELRRYGLNSTLAQCSLSFNRVKGTVRGLHYQMKPVEEAKLIRCTAGAVYDVIVDLRQGSPSFSCWFAIELSAENRRTVYVPEGVAHGFQTLTDASELLYMISVPYHPELASGIRWDDPTVAVKWPLEVTMMSERDRSFPYLNV